MKLLILNALGLVTLSLLVPEAAAASNEVPSFKRKIENEKKFVAEVGEAIIKAAHKTAKKIGVVEYKYTNPKANRTELNIKMEYFGAVSNKKYIADIVVKIDSTEKSAWEVLSIDYSDNNTIPHNRKKLEELVKQMNK